MGDGLEGLLAGRTLVGRYRIEEVIGRGGFAVVYRAEDLRLGRPVAVKVITRAALDEAGRDALRERFQHEARAAASLPHHPNVVTVHDFGTDQETGIDFLAMELLIGETLAQYLAAHPRPVREVALHILRAAAEGVAIGHRAGVVHRDVKPGNIFLAEPLDDSHPFRICVLDFGIAGLVDGEDATLAGGEAVALSPAYASPEQLRGERRLAPTSDVFSLGLVGMQLLTGRKPERPADPAAPIPTPGPEVPPALAAVLQRAVSPDAAARFADAGAFAEALDAATQTLPPDVGDLAAAAAAPHEDRTVLYPVGALPDRPRRRAGAAWLMLLVPLLAGGVWALTRDHDGSPATVLSADSVAPVDTESGGAVAAPEPAPPPIQTGPIEPLVTPETVPVAPPGVTPRPVPIPVPTPAEPEPRPAPEQPQPPAPRPEPQPQPRPEPPPQPRPEPVPPPQPTPQPTPPQPQPRPVPTETVPSVPIPAPPRDTIRIPATTP